MHSILVRDYMQTDPLVFDRNTNLLQAVHKLLAAKATGAPVVDEQRKVVGFVSEQDCIKEILQGAFYCEDPPSVASVMSTEVLSVKPDQSIVEVAEFIIKQKPKIYPVISEDKLIGVMSRRDVLSALLDNDEDCYLRAK
ncbi:CBS domain-containing protein [Gilvimarinus agarilyticus]|uniref:CBS domain-containing protein n=1 Tax=unclassified Gilvimarinus TaxID=2642066 RepID=UPI001C0A4E60|nr:MULTISPECIES: CBS domain-containing protein [unclassified Gilvimarinus]MBU2885099.1 CBS domain-containing protein [Gilvimarinus agarilyticus]MDO6569996.1 CBS domain-containing protein [Gilvimarinus sp. 2_MG-2023]MDO6747262.1 CBS domain-containing protein [Gilvimarinus sp. 1_MG-2023]